MFIWNKIDPMDFFSINFLIFNVLFNFSLFIFFCTFAALTLALFFLLSPKVKWILLHFLFCVKTVILICSSCYHGSCVLFCFVLFCFCLVI